MEDGREIFDEDDNYDDSIFTSKKKKEKPKENHSKKNEVKHMGGDIKKMFANIPSKKRKVEVIWFSVFCFKFSMY